MPCVDPVYGGSPIVSRDRRQEIVNPVTLIVDSMSWLLRHLSPFAVCKCLQQLKKGQAVRTVHQRGVVRSVEHLGAAVITLTPGLRGHEATAKTTRRLKSGKVMQHEDLFTIKDDLTVTVRVGYRRRYF